MPYVSSPISHRHRQDVDALRTPRRAPACPALRPVVSLCAVHTHVYAAPQRAPSHSARVAPGGPPLPHPTAPGQPPRRRAGPPQPWALGAPAGLLCGPGRAGRAVGGACSPAGGAGGVLPGWWRKNAVCFSYPPGAAAKLWYGAWWRAPHCGCNLEGVEATMASQSCPCKGLPAPASVRLPRWSPCGRYGQVSVGESIGEHFGHGNGFP